MLTKVELAFSHIKEEDDDDGRGTPKGRKHAHTRREEGHTNGSTEHWQPEAGGRAHSPKDGDGVAHT